MLEKDDRERWGMKKAILINLDLLKTDNYIDSNVLTDLISNLNELTKDEENAICFYSIDYRTINMYEKLYQEEYPNSNFVFKTRTNVEKAMESHKDKSNYYVVVGRKNADFFMAIKHKVLLIVPTWITMEEKAEKYGVKVDNIKQLIKFFNTLNNQNYWYSKLQVDDNTSVLSLMDARYGFYAKSYKEKEMIQNFQNLLKKGISRSYYDILLYHFLSAMTNTNIFDDITLWGIIPSSDCTLNDNILQFKETVRGIKRGVQPRNLSVNNLLIRHKIKEKAHYDKFNRLTYGAEKEFETLLINPEFKTKIESLKKEAKLNICIFDDYLTHGNTFESVRNLFNKLGANKIICVSLGSFCTCYKRNDYIMSGDLYNNTYSYRHINNMDLHISEFNINDKAKSEIDSLYNIFNN